MIDNLPNFMMVDDSNESPAEIVEDFLEMIMEFKNDRDVVEGFLHDFFDEVNYWSVKQMLIDQAKIAMGHLQQLAECEHEFIEDELED